MNPFLGARPYGPADDRRFFGRRTATASLVEHIDLHRLTIISAPSGLGKTSLLRAAVMPWLERDGLSPIYLRPDPPLPGVDGPEAEAASALLNGRLTQALLRALIPDCDLEFSTLLLLAEAAPAELVLGDSPSWFAKLSPTDEHRFAILTPSPGSPEILSMLARYLRGTASMAALEHHARRVGAIEYAQLIADNPTVERLVECFPRSEFTRCTSTVRMQLSRREPIITLEDDLALILTTLDRLCGESTKLPPLSVRPDGDLDLSARVILLLDQFEQVFTMSGAETCRRAIQLIAGLLSVDAPINIVLSLRKEWYSDLNHQLLQHLAQGYRVNRVTYFLQPMDRSEANEVMREVPRSAGAPALSSAQQESIFSLLQVDEAIDSVVLSIACHKHFANPSAPDTTINAASIENIFQAYLTSAFQSFEDEYDRNEALDVLSEIAGSKTTRGFATQDKLINAPLADPTVRARILKGLQSAFLVKGEDLGRSRGKVFDIMHERLLAPVHKMLNQRPDIAAFRDAADLLDQEEAWEQGIHWDRCRALLGAKRHVTWDARSAGVLLISLLNVDRRWRRRTSADPDLPIRTLAMACQAATSPKHFSYSARARLRLWMTREEILKQLSQSPDFDGDGFALKSLLQGPDGWMTPELKMMARRLANS